MKLLLILMLLLSLFSCEVKKEDKPKTNSLVIKNMTDVILGWETSNALGKKDNHKFISPKYNKYKQNDSNFDNFLKGIPDKYLQLQLEWAYGSEHIFAGKKVVLVRYFLSGESIKVFDEKLLDLEDDGKYYIIPAQFWDISIRERDPGSNPDN